MSIRTVITGGAGFIGSHLAELLKPHHRGAGDELVLIDDLSTGSRANVAPLLDDRCRLIEGKVGEVVAEQPGLVAGATQVFHLAAAVGVRLIVEDAAAAIRNNIDETAALLDAAQAGASSNRPVVLIASSSEVYGKSSRVPMSEEQDIVVGPTTSPRWSYGLSKALDEHLALAHAKRGLPVVIVRLFNTIGPRQVGRYGMVVPRFVKDAVEGRDLEVHGDGKQTRAFCDVRDVVVGIAALVATPTAHGRVYNLGSDAEISINELADRVIALSGAAVTKRYTPYERAYEPGFEDTPRRVPDLSRIRAAIHFQPQRTLDQTLTELIALARRDASGVRSQESGVSSHRT